MTITKKHLNELADIVYEARKLCDGNNDALAHFVDLKIQMFAKRHAPNFDHIKWNEYMHKLKKAEDRPEPNKRYRLVGKSGESSIARGNTWAESEIK